jgi:hypothetical protein
MTAQQEARETQSSSDLFDQLMAIVRPRGASLGAMTAIIALVRQSIHMAIRNADGSVNEGNARKILREAHGALRGVSASAI